MIIIPKNKYLSNLFHLYKYISIIFYAKVLFNEYLVFDKCGCVSRASLQNIMGIFPPGVEEDFRDINNEFTVFMPASEAFLYLSQPEILYLHNLVNSTEKYEVLISYLFVIFLMLLFNRYLTLYW